MEDPRSEIKVLVEAGQQYILGTVELYKLKAIDKASDGIASFIAKILLIPFVLLFLIAINIAITLWIGEELGRMSYGFFIMGGTYGLIGLFLYLFGNTLIKSPVKNVFIKYASKIKLPWEKQKHQKN